MSVRKVSNTASSVRYNTPLLFLMLALVLLHGGFETYTVLLTGILLIVFLLQDAFHKKRLLLPKSREGLLLSVLPLAGLLISPLAVSPGASLSGALRMAVWLLFFCYVLTYTQEEKVIILDTLAYEGILLSLISSIIFFLRQISDDGDLNGRLDGFFQYANTWALYLLVSLILLVFKPHRNKFDLVGSLVLTSGILLTGSRSIILLLFLLVFAGTICLAIRQRKPIPALFCLLLLGFVFIVAQWLSGGMLLQRLTAISLSSSSLNGRLLYWLDGLHMLADHPLGVGRGGYLYLQPLYQTGDYIVRFVHNSYLQAALDGSVFAGLCTLLLPISFLLRKTIPLRQRLTILVIAVHALIDCDFEFSVIPFLMLLCGSEPERGSIISVSTSLRRKGILSVGSLLAGVLFCLSVPYLSFFAGNSNTAGRLLPADLELSEQRLLTLSSMEDAEREADRILARTNLSMVALDCKKIACEQRGDYTGAAQVGFLYLRLNPYRGQAYRDFAQLLQTAVQQANSTEYDTFASLAVQAGAQLQEVMSRTSPLAFRIAEKPDWSFAAEVQADYQAVEKYSPNYPIAGTPHSEWRG